jgi:acetyltransferase-like isoleucine patch superfamily enzyme
MSSESPQQTAPPPPSHAKRFARLAARGARFLINRLVYAPVNRFTLWSQDVRCAKTPRINGLIHVRNEGVLEIGLGVHINSGQYYNAIGGDAVCNIVVRPGARIRIGDRCAMSNATLHAFTSIELGDDVGLGGGCRIYDTDFHPIDPTVRRDADPLAETTATAPVRVESGAWIGGHSTILKGVTIGRDAIIGAGSVVAKSVPPSEIWAGNPARFIRRVGAAPS